MPSAVEPRQACAASAREPACTQPDDAVREDVGRRWMAAMRAGDWEAAWRQTDRIELPRRAAARHSPGLPREPHQLVWDGSPWRGREVLVRCEHGLGDTLQFSRFLPTLAREAAALHVMLQPALLSLLQGLPGLGRVHDGWAGPDWPAHEIELEVMELAYALRATPASLAPPLPAMRQRAIYRAPPPPLATAAPAGVARVGLVWAASDWDTSRSIALPLLAPLLAVPGVAFFGLQQGEAAADPALHGLPITLLSRHTADPLDAAAALAQLDLLVCVDGMPAHLAGSLGVPTWLLLKHDADWRWMDDREDSPWYPSMRLFRQRRPGDWAGLLAEVARALRAAVPALALRDATTAAAAGGAACAAVTASSTSPASASTATANVSR